MWSNVGLNERIIRILSSGAILGIGIFIEFDKNWTIATYTIGFFFLFSGIIGYGPVWKVLGVKCSSPPVSKKD
ncbi:MAG TPA: DUF2892 domain-containing protein [Nitrospiria bacterium]|jgi:hypothetical protein